MSPIVIVAIVVVVLVAAALLVRGRRSVRQPAVERPRVPGRRAASGFDVGGHFTQPNEAKLDWLIGVSGDVAGREFHVKGDGVTIGRSPTNRIQTVDRLASREHVRLTPIGSGLLLEDLGSGNGTLVNGVAQRRVELRYGDRVTIGEASWVYEMRSRSTEEADAGAGARVGGEVAAKTTSLAGDGAMSDIDAALAAAGGDVEEAARTLGVTPEFVQRLLAQRRLRATR